MTNRPRLYQNATSSINTLAKPPAVDLEARLGELKSSIRPYSPKLIPRANKTPKLVFFEKIYQAAPGVALLQLIASCQMGAKTFQPRFAVRLSKRHALNNVKTVYAMLTKTEIVKATHL